MHSLKGETMSAPDKTGKDNQQIDGIDKVIHEPARFLIMSHLYIVESADFVYLVRQTGLTWGNLSFHIKKLSDAGYVKVKKEFLDNKPHTMLQLTKPGKSVFEEYRKNMKQMLELPPG